MNTLVKLRNVAPVLMKCQLAWLCVVVFARTNKILSCDML